MPTALHVSVELRFMSCTECGIQYAVDEAYMAERQRSGGSWHCPNGHGREYRETEVIKLRKQLDEERRKRESAERGESFAVAAKNTAERKRKQLEKRVKNGVCPCCQRSFLNVQRHMKTKHPEFATEQVAQA